MIVAGIDVALKKLDVVVTGRPIFSVRYTPAGLRGLTERLSAAKVELVVIEATGGYQLFVHQSLAGAGFAVACVNPRNVRDYARSCGLLEKSDAIDARVLEAFGRERRPRSTPAPTESEVHLKNLVQRRKQLADILGQERTRAAHPFLGAKESLGRMIAALEAELVLIDREIDNIVALKKAWRERATLLQSMPGIGRRIAAVLIATVPELGTLNHKAIAKLVGVAPLAWDSGQLRGQRHIAGGRAQPRSMLYMAAMVNIRHNPVIRDYFASLRARGKHGSVAIVAVMRKLLVTANAMLRDGRAWQTPSALAA